MSDEPEIIPLSDEQKKAFAEGRGLLTTIDFTKLPREDQELVYRHVTGKELPPHEQTSSVP